VCRRHSPATDRAAGYTHRLALQQVEVSLTQVFAQPIQGRNRFEAVIRENLDLVRPDRVSLLFPLQLTMATPPPAWGYRTRVITDGVEPSLHTRIQVVARQAVLQRAARFYGPRPRPTTPRISMSRKQCRICPTCAISATR
jgi:hypothetical protein